MHMRKGRAPCCAKVGLNKGSWTPEEDTRLIAYIHKYGHATWRALPKEAGLLRCGKSCRLRWINYLRPDLKRGNFTAEEVEAIIKLQSTLGNKWSKIAACLPGRTDNEIKNVWNTHLTKRVAATASAGEPKEPTCADIPELPPLPATTSFFFYSGDSREQSNTNKEEQELDKIEIPVLDLDLGFELDMLLDAIPQTHCSSASHPCVEIDIVREHCSITDGEGGAGACTETTTQASSNNAAPRHGNGTGAWWLEDLERELGLLGPIEDYQYQPDPQGKSGIIHST